MATLTETAYYTRKSINIFIITIIGYFVFRFSFHTAVDIWKKLNPPPPPPPTVQFGKLPALVFPESNSLPELTFRLETISGGLPTTFPLNGKVYFMSQKIPTFFALERAQDKARILGFSQKPEKITDSLYRWQTNEEPPTFLEMDINSGNFKFRNEYEKNPQLSTSKNLPSENQAISEAKNLIKSVHPEISDYDQGSGKATLLIYEPPNFLPAPSFSEANFMKVDLFRSDLDEMKILPADPNKSQVNFLFSGVREQGRRIVEINFTYFTIEKESFATYPLKTVDNAWQEIQNKQGYIARLGENTDGNIIIRNVYLAYYDSSDYQTFLQPIYVFEGDKNFSAYIPAIDPQWQE